METDEMELHVRVHREDGALWAEVDELPGCFASGKTAAELVEAVEEAVVLYLGDDRVESRGRRQAITLSGLTIATQRLQIA